MGVRKVSELNAANKILATTPFKCWINSRRMPHGMEMGSLTLTELAMYLLEYWFVTSTGEWERRCWTYHKNKKWKSLKKGSLHCRSVWNQCHSPPQSKQNMRMFFWHCLFPHLCCELVNGKDATNIAFAHSYGVLPSAMTDPLCLLVTENVGVTLSFKKKMCTLNQPYRLLVITVFKKGGGWWFPCDYFDACSLCISLEHLMRVSTPLGHVKG